MVLTAGVDVGAKTVKVVIAEGGDIIAKNMLAAGIDTESTIDRAYAHALQDANLNRNDVCRVWATGVGGKLVDFAMGIATEVTVAAKGASRLFPDARIVVEVGSEEARAIKINHRGKVIDFVVNDKCASGCGAFIETIARTLEIPLQEFGQYSLESTRSIPINAQCVVFAESEVVSMVHSQIPKEDIARAVTEVIAGRIIAMVRRLGLEKEVALVGGLAKNIGFAKALAAGLGLSLLIPSCPEYIGAYGSALVAIEK